MDGYLSGDHEKKSDLFLNPFNLVTVDLSGKQGEKVILVNELYGLSVEPAFVELDNKDIS